jgi:hypothetical protein
MTDRPVPLLRPQPYVPLWPDLTPKAEKYWTVIDRQQIEWTRKALIEWQQVEWTRKSQLEAEAEKQKLEERNRGI